MSVIFVLLFSSIPYNVNFPDIPVLTTLLAADVISDAILIFAPLQLVWRTTLSRAQKIRITAIFSTTFITTAVSMNHVYFVLEKGGLEEALAAVIQVRHFIFYAMFFQSPSSFPKLGWCMHQLAGCSSDHASFASPTMPFTEIFSQAFMYPLIGTLSAS